MNLWNGVLWLAFLTSLGAVVAQFFALHRTEVRRVARGFATATAALLGVSFLYLCLLFLGLDLRVEYVWLYTADWVTWPYRLAGAWTGREGSLLLWTAFMAIVGALLAWRHTVREDDEESRTARDWTHLVLFGLLALFVLAVARQGLFDRTADYLLSGRPGGNGINPTLRNPYILIHPPMMFLAYALTIVPASSGLAHLLTGTDRWSRIAATASRADWILYTFAMGLGGMWAYYTLGFGGYWAWDPVEVANLLPWLALTVYVHAQMMHARKGHFRTAGPMLAILPFVLTVFSTVSTRSGLWVSVHAFTDPTNSFDPDAAARLLGILGVDTSLLPYFGILLGTLLVGLALWSRRLAIDHGTLRRTAAVVSGLLAAAGTLALLAPATFLSFVFQAAAVTGSPGLGALGLLVLAVLGAAAPALWSRDEPAPRQGLLQRITLPHLAALSVLLLGIVLVVSILWHFGAVNGWSEAFWDARVPFLATPVALALMVLLLMGQRGRLRAVQGAGAAFAVAVLVGLFGGLGAYAVTLSALLLVAAVDKMQAIAFRGPAVSRLGSLLLWAGAVLDVVFWVDPPSSILGGLFHPAWPAQLFMVPVALVALWGAHRIGLGQRAFWPYVLVGVLGAYYLAPALALAAWWMHRRAPAPSHALDPRAVRLVGVYGVHLVVALLFLGYATSTYYETVVSGEFDQGQTIPLTGADVHVLPITLDLDGARVDAFHVLVRAADDGPGAGTGDARLYYEPQTFAYYPLPGVLRQAGRDVYVQVDAVCFLPIDQCDADDWIEAYATMPPAVADGFPRSARLTVHTLPGIGMVWGALVLFAAYGLPMALVRDPAVRD